MEFWIRTATIQLGAKKYSLDELTFDFEVPFEDSEELATATINAYNLSASTRKGIKKGDPVIINAGYEGDMASYSWGKSPAYPTSGTLPTGRRKSRPPRPSTNGFQPR